MLVHTYFLNLRNKAFEESGGWLCWESTERCLGNPALQTFYCDDFFFGSLSHVSYVRNFAFYLRYCFHAFLGFPLCLFLQKKDSAFFKILKNSSAFTTLSSLKWAVTIALWHESLSRVSSCHLWSPSNEARSSALCNETTEFPTGYMSQVSDQLAPLRSVLKEKCATSTHRYKTHHHQESLPRELSALWGEGFPILQSFHQPQKVPVGYGANQYVGKSQI